MIGKVEDAVVVELGGEVEMLTVLALVWALNELDDGVRVEPGVEVEVETDKAVLGDVVVDGDKLGEVVMGKIEVVIKFVILNVTVTPVVEAGKVSVAPVGLVLGVEVWGLDWGEDAVEEVDDVVPMAGTDSEFCGVLLFRGVLEATSVGSLKWTGWNDVGNTDVVSSVAPAPSVLGMSLGSP